MQSGPNFYTCYTLKYFLLFKREILGALLLVWWLLERKPLLILLLSIWIFNLGRECLDFAMITMTISLRAFKKDSGLHFVSKIVDGTVFTYPCFIGTVSTPTASSILPLLTLCFQTPKCSQIRKSTAKTTVDESIRTVAACQLRLRKYQVGVRCPCLCNIIHCKILFGYCITADWCTHW